MAISRVFDIARRGLATYQGALDITSNNIANASNTNYSRQRAVLQTETPQKIGQLVWGMGVTLSTIERVHDNLLERQITNYTQNYSYQKTKSNILSQVEQIFSEPTNSGLAGLMDKFYSAWQELSVSPNSTTLRTQVVNSAQNISTKVKEVYSDFDIVNTDSVNNFKTGVEEINQLLKNIQNYNARIYESTAVGENPNDLLDQRDKAINDLSNLVNINVTYSDKNVAQISIGGIFSADASYVAEFDYSLANGKLALIAKDTQKKAMLTGGELNGIAEVYNNVLPSYATEIDTIMNKLVESVNSIHMTGYSNTDPLQTNLKFFDGYESGNLIINQSIIDDPRNIAVSSDGTEGNGDIAIKIAELADKELIDGSTLSERYGSLLNKVGNDIVGTDNLVDSYQQIMEQLSNQKSSYSGVSTDEEMTNILIYQRAYQACSKIISIENEILETLINMV